jgi:hypothetical protein
VLFIGEPKLLSLELVFKNTVLFDEIAGGGLLMAVKPAGQGDAATGEIRTPDRLVRSYDHGA